MCIMKMVEELDVICQHKSDGTIIPLRIRIKDEEGEYQTYTIKGYKDLSYKGAYQMPNGVTVTNDMLSYECMIHVFGRPQRLWLLYSLTRNQWTAYI